MREIGFVRYPLALGCFLLAGVAGGEQKMGYGFCAASARSGAQYFSAAFAAPLADAHGADPSWQTQTAWGTAFTEYLKRQFGEKDAAFTCPVLPSLADAQAGLKTRMKNLRFGRPVETGWAPGSQVPASAPPP
jgi:hypothetical protein